MGSPAASAWEIQVPVPALENEVEETWSTSQAYVAGDPVLFHISNHGANNWALMSLTATYPVPASE
jgi:hypothetical protein